MQNPNPMLAPGNSQAPVKEKKTKSKFTPQEDQMLSDLVARFGENDWKAISFCMRTRSVRQCRERWQHYLSPRVVNVPWTAAEDFLLDQKYMELGPRWKAIAQFFPHRTDIQVKNRVLLKQRRMERIARNFPLQFPLPSYLVHLLQNHACQRKRQETSWEQQQQVELEQVGSELGDFELDEWFSDCPLESF